MGGVGKGGEQASVGLQIDSLHCLRLPQHERFNLT